MKASRLALLTLATLSGFSSAQPPVLRDLAEGIADQVSQRNDIEGGVWEYKVLERSGDKTTILVGKFRVDGAAAFDVPGSAEGAMLDEKGVAGGGAQAGQAGGPFGLKLPAPPRLGALDQLAEVGRGGDRIGDIVYQKSRNSTNATPKVTIRFDTDDKHPLSGEANMKLDTRHGGGVWRGSYVEQPKQGKKRRWGMELRLIED
jgi:hypothetical protein